MPDGDWIAGLSIGDLRGLTGSGERSIADVVAAYVDRIERLDGPHRSVVEVNPDAATIAEELDAELATSGPRSPLHGVPILLKENIDTDDAMLTTAGSLSLMESRPTQDAGVAARLREAGAVILGKTGMSEWAFFRSTHGTTGWSGRNGQVGNAHDPARFPGGSSSGSGVAPALSFCGAAIGTETDGSIVSPSSANGVVGIKPTVGLTSRAGVIPISHTQDTIGPLARSVADAAAVLDAISGPDERDAATVDGPVRPTATYESCVRSDALEGARIGVGVQFFGRSPKADRIALAAIDRMRSAGAEIVELEHIADLEAAGKAERVVLVAEFKADLAAYLATREGPGPRNVEDVMAFNLEHADVELAHFGQELVEAAVAAGPLTSDEYLDALATGRRLAGTEGLDRVFEENGLDTIVAPTAAPAPMTDLVNGDHRLLGSSSLCAVTGYPIISLPAGWVAGLPVGLSFMGRAWSEPELIALAASFEHTHP